MRPGRVIAAGLRGDAAGGGARGLRHVGRASRLRRRRASRSSSWNGPGIVGAVAAVCGRWRWRCATCAPTRTAMRHDLARAVERGRRLARAARGGARRSRGSAIRRQFEAWGLTPAEADIAGLMLKGVSLRDIARLRHTSETTIRQQAQGVYRKSGLSGRAELAAYFLELLFEQRPARTRLGVVDRRLRAAARSGFQRGLADDAALDPRRLVAAVQRADAVARRRRRPWCGAGCAACIRPRSAVW